MCDEIHAANRHTFPIFENSALFWQYSTEGKLRNFYYALIPSQYNVQHGFAARLCIPTIVIVLALRQQGYVLFRSRNTNSCRKTLRPESVKNLSYSIFEGDGGLTPTEPENEKEADFSRLQACRTLYCEGNSRR